jgi:signal transduction histidine kinase
MDNTLLQAERKFLLREAEGLRAIIASCASEETLEGILAIIIDRSIEVTEARDAQVLLLENSGDIFRVYARSGAGDGRLTIDRMPLGGSLTAQVVSSGEPLLCNDVLADPRANQELARRWGVRSLAIAPLRIRDKTIGTLAAINHRQHEFRRVDLDTLSSFVNHAAIVIGYVQLMEAEKLARNRFEQVARERQDLLSRTISIQEDERRRIAADVHDRVVSRVVGALYEVDRCLDTQRAPHEMGEHLALARDLLNEAVERARASVYALWPPALDELGITAALRQLLGRQQTRTGIAHRLDLTGTPRELGPTAKTAAYRIVQEALTNVHHHAVAKAVLVSVAFRGSSLRITVADDGQGFDVDSIASSRGHDHFGIISMRERALSAGGHLEVRSRPGDGSQVLLILPLDGSGAQ